MTLQKPFTPEQLVHALEMAIGARLPTKEAALGVSFVLTPGKSSPAIDAKPSYATRKVLLVDDSSADAKLIQRWLSDSRLVARVDVVSDGPSALEFLAEQFPDLILLDLNLPRSDGLNVLLMIRSAPKLSQIPIGILTSSQASADRLRAVTVGVSRYIVKPSPYDQFLSEVSQAVEYLLDALWLHA